MKTLIKEVAVALVLLLIGDWLKNGVLALIG